MARSELDIIIDVEGTAAAKREIEGLSGSLGSFTSVVTKGAAAIGGVGLILDQAFELGDQGAQVIQTKESFDLLLESVGAAPDLFEELDAAAGGTISEFALMSSTATLLAGAQGELGTELANATPQLLEIARAANKLNPALGDTTFLYDSLATGIKRASPLILDNLGLTISVGQANEAYAASLGKTVEELTEEEKKLALLNATLAAGDVLIDQVGGTTDSAADDFARLNASIENITNDMKTLFVPGLAAAAGGLEAMLTNGIAMTSAMYNLAAGFKSGVVSLQEFQATILGILPHIRDFLEVINPFAGGFGQTVAEANQAVQQFEVGGIPIDVGSAGGGDAGTP